MIEILTNWIPRMNRGMTEKKEKEKITRRFTQSLYSMRGAYAQSPPSALGEPKRYGNKGMK